MVSRVRLELNHQHANQVYRFIRPDGSLGAIPALRLRVFLDLMKVMTPSKRASVAAFPYCILDTGSHLTTVPEYIHSLHKPGIISPLPFDPSMPRSLRSVTVANGTFPYRLGLLPLKLMDLDGGELDVALVAQFVEDRGALDQLPLILGLQGGLLEGRTLTSISDAAAPHGQSWLLEE